jgi:hypothetical protein
MALDDRRRQIQIDARRSSMGAQIQAGCPGGRLHEEAASLAIAAYFSGRYSRRRAPATRRGIALSPSQVRRVRDRHFSKVFKTFIGTTPRQYRSLY